MKKIYTFLLLAVISISANSQNRLLFNHYLSNPETFNPGFMDVQTEFRATLLYRIQNVSQPNFPQDAYFNTSYHLHKNHGLGLTINNQNMNKFNLFEAGVNYAFHAWLNNTMALGFGLNVNFYQQTFNPSIFNAKDISDPVFDAQRVVRGVNFGLGASLQSKSLTVNLSFPRFFNNTLVDPKYMWKTKFSTVYMSGSYNFEINKYFSIMPAVLMRVAGGSPLNVLANVQCLLNNAFIFGAGYKMGNSINATVGYKFDFGLRISYNFETAPIGKATGIGTAHEIGVGFYTPFSKPGFDQRKVMKANGKVKGMHVRKYKGNGEL